MFQNGLADSWSGLRDVEIYVLSECQKCINLVLKNKNDCEPLLIESFSIEIFFIL